MTNVKVYAGPFLKVYNAGPDVIKALKNDVLRDCWEEGIPVILVLPISVPYLFGQFLDKRDLMKKLEVTVDWSLEAAAIQKLYPEATILMESGIVCLGSG